MEQLFDGRATPTPRSSVLHCKVRGYRNESVRDRRQSKASTRRIRLARGSQSYEEVANDTGFSGGDSQLALHTKVPYPDICDHESNRPFVIE